MTRFSTHSAYREENVIERLKRRTNDARTLGFQVRTEYLDGEQATWCMIGKQKTIFMDLSQTAAEQLRQLDESLAEYRSSLAASEKRPRQAA
ncbi:hypothetical protein [Novipirellula artificiosorum]|uniref:Uncharacterized protein n=1 Tax=Novipirellula artificiosorum TaxID=2528016 RepID=A0A5C6DVY8_9BACT|nr:hypothetical protein [Novipirellula artificiosorum]TWU40752.1 hypothetical protein Poly41_15870 [Novipirellula artificiosorum]